MVELVAGRAGTDRFELFGQILHEIAVADLFGEDLFAEVDLD